MESLARELAAPFERVTEGGASAILLERFGLGNATVTRLATEKDDTFRVQSEHGDFVLKIAHPGDDPLVINLQTAALAFASEMDARLPLQRILPSLDGELEPTVTTGEGRGRIARVLTWLPGGLLRGSPPTGAQLEQLGTVQARLAIALEDFRHPAADRELAWDVARLPALRPLLRFAPEAEPVLDRIEHLGERIAALPHQFVHNDLNLDNVIVDAADPAFVTGILDFGDAVFTARAIDLAVSLSYLVQPGDPDPLATLRPLVDGYLRTNPLTDAELQLLPDLVAGRVAQRLLIACWLAGQVPENAAYASRNIELSRGQLAALRNQE